MSTANWKVIYRDYDKTQLDAEEARLKKEAENLYLAQSTGRRSYQRSITSVEERLRAIAEIRREQSGRDYYQSTYVDFSHD